MVQIRFITLSLLLVLSVFAAYAYSASAQFLFDDYVHLSVANKETWNVLISRVMLIHPNGGDMFFRPVGAVYYWAVFKLAAFNPVVWHLCSVALHSANTVLVFLLAFRLVSSLTPAFLAALIFGWHGAHVEDVCWLAASFDLLAAFFVLLVLVLVTRIVATYPNKAAILTLSALACLSKEAAYCLPLLVVCVAFYFNGKERGEILWRAVPVGLACSCVFVYRLWYLQGFGGYQVVPRGKSILTTLHPISTAQALALRVWALLFIPINWSEEPGEWLGVAAVLMLLSLGIVVSKGKVRTPNLAPAILFVLVAALPVVPVLLIGSDLAGSRVLYLPSAGVALVWMGILQAATLKRLTFGVGVPAAMFQVAALLHNQRIWVEVSQRSRQACLDTATLQKENPDSSISVYSLPKTAKGIYFLQNGFPECVEINGGVDAGKVAVRDGNLPSPLPDAHNAFWNRVAGRIERLN